MASQAQIDANRRNSQKSTGPRFLAGKAVSRFNALKSGINAKVQVIPDEDPAELETLAANYHLQFQPSTPLEFFLVDSIVTADWQLRRLRKIEAQVWHMELHFAPDVTPGERLTRLHRRIDAAERSYYRALKELQTQIEARSETAEPELPAEPAPPDGSEKRTQFQTAGADAQALSAPIAGSEPAGFQPSDPLQPVHQSKAGVAAGVTRPTGARI